MPTLLMGLSYGIRSDGWRLSVNGKGNSWLPYGKAHTLLGAMPATIHPAPLDVAVVGLGSGDTAWASAWRPETRSPSTTSAPPMALNRDLWPRDEYAE